VVGEADLMQANSLNAVSDSLTRLIGPALGGVLFALLGLASVVVVDAATFFASAALVALMVLPAATTASTRSAAQSVTAAWRSVWSDWLHGLRFVAHDRMLSRLFLVMGVFSVGDSIFTALMVAFVKNMMQGGTEELGWLMAAQG